MKKNGKKRYAQENKIFTGNNKKSVEIHVTKLEMNDIRTK